MTKSVIFHAETVEKAIEAGLKQLGVDRSQVRIEVLSEPKKSIFGLPTKSATVRLTIVEDDNNDVEVKENSVPTDGALWVESGELKYAPPQDGGDPPILVFDDLVTVYYNGVQGKHRLELDQGIEPLQLTLPQEQQPKKELKVVVSSDQLQAYLRINRVGGYRYYLLDQPPSKLLELKLDREVTPAPEITTDEIMALLRDAGITYGFDLQKLRAPIADDEDEILVATGKAPVQPQDGYVQYEFDKYQTQPDLDADRIDYYELKPILSVERGAVLAKRIPGVPGENGINVYGKEIPVPKAKEKPILVGDGVYLSDDELTAYAERDGLPVLQNGVLKVLKVFELGKDANLQTGNIRFNGEIIIRGNVSDRVKIEAISGGVQVYGIVDQAEIEADRDVVVMRNVIAARIKAGGLGAIYTKVCSHLHELESQFFHLIQSFMLVHSRTGMVDTGSLIKNLIEIKFNKIPKMISDFDTDFQAAMSSFPPDFRTLILELKSYFLDRGPLKIKDISLVRQFVEQMQYWQTHFQTNADQGADVQLGYLQSSSIEASGKVVVNGKGVYYSSIVAGKGYYQPRGVFRSSHVVVESGNIDLREIGSQSGSAASASITNKGQMILRSVYPNVTVAYGNQKYRFLQPAANVKVLWTEEDGMVIYSGSNKIL
ncbi:MAG TPA: FapA family protein [Firmicutes bacterium]|nr:FapA family protein [Bacillota bacterium]